MDLDFCNLYSSYLKNNNCDGLSSLTHLGRSDEGLCDLPVSSSVASGDEVGHAAAFQEGCRAHWAFAENFGKGNHFHQAKPDYRRFGVVATVEAITESSADRHNILAMHEGKGANILRFSIIQGEFDYGNVRLPLRLHRAPLCHSPARQRCESWESASVLWRCGRLPHFLLL